MLKIEKKNPHEPRKFLLMIGKDGYLWAFNKPAGLPTHPGTGHERSRGHACHRRNR